MKKSLLLNCAVALTLASCTTNEDILEVNSERDLIFSTFVDKATPTTRSAETKLEAIHTTFGAWGYNNTSNEAAWDFVFGSQRNNNNNAEKISWNTHMNVWSYTDVQKWIPNRYYKFFAFAPYEGVSANMKDEEKTPLIGPRIIKFPDFEIKRAEGATGNEVNYSEKKNQIDLMVSEVHERGTYTFDNHPIDLVFKHVLTNVNLKFKSTSEYPIHILEVKLKDIYSKANGTVTANNHNTAQGYPSAKVSARWTDFKNPLTFCGAITSSNDPLVKESTNGTTLFTSMDSMYMIPQTIENLTLSVKYKVGNENASSVNTFTKEVSLGASETWTAGTRVTYIITINTGNQSGDGTNISFGSSSVTDWEDKIENIN